MVLFGSAEEVPEQSSSEEHEVEPIGHTQTVVGSSRSKKDVQDSMRRFAAVASPACPLISN